MKFTPLLLIVSFLLLSCAEMKSKPRYADDTPKPGRGLFTGEAGEWRLPIYIR